MPVYLYLLSQTVNNGYDTFDSCVVTAGDEAEARLMQPADWGDLSVWAKPEDVQVRLIGIATHDEAGKVICASFNAG